MEMNAYSNGLKQEMMSYLDLLAKAGKTTNHVKSLFNELDGVIPDDTPALQALAPKIIFYWDANLKCSPATRKKKYITLRGFMKYLNANGFHFEIPDVPNTISSTYAPYIFDDNEWAKIISTADNLACTLKVKGSDMPIVFPMLLRLLYSCGLRLSEALGLKMKDIDFHKNVFIIRKAKRGRQRFVPMKQSTADILKKYCMRMGLFENDDLYLFSGKNQKPYAQSWVERWFSVTLELCGIRQTRSKPGERGICPHCIRHTFTYRSFQNADKSFEEMVPFLSTYLGHENIRETDRYLRFSYELYEDAHKIISDYTQGLFPEVCDEG